MCILLEELVCVFKLLVNCKCQVLCALLENLEKKKKEMHIEIVNKLLKDLVRVHAI